MSVPRGKRSEAKVIYFTQANKIIDAVTVYLLKDFGTTKTYRDLTLFTERAKMDLDDRNTIHELANKYHFEVEASYPDFIFDYYRKEILAALTILLDHITRAHSMYPNSVYEFNIKRQYQTDAISDCYKVKHMLQCIMRIFNANNLEKFLPIVEMIDNEIQYLKNWRKDSNNVKRACYERDSKLKKNADSKVMKEITENAMRINQNYAPIPGLAFYDEHNNFISFG